MLELNFPNLKYDIEYQQKLAQAKATPFEARSLAMFNLRKHYMDEAQRIIKSSKEIVEESGDTLLIFFTYMHVWAKTNEKIAEESLNDLKDSVQQMQTEDSDKFAQFKTIYETLERMPSDLAYNLDRATFGHYDKKKPLSENYMIAKVRELKEEKKLPACSL